MKVLFVLGKYLPYKKGGIENYSHLLANALKENGHTVDIAILDRTKVESYTFEEIPVIALRADLQMFTSVLQKKHYDICHIHEYHGARGINIAWFKVAKLYCEKVFFTFHLPYLTCYKNDFRYKGIEDCDHFTNVERCLNCIIASKLNYKQGSYSRIFNPGINYLISAIKGSSKIKRLRKRIQSNNDDLNELIKICDQLFVYGEWFNEILLRNGYNSPKLKLIPHLIKPASEAKKDKSLEIKSKILFAGRIEQQKGLHLLCKAMNLISVKEVELDAAGNIVDERYFKLCSKEYSFNYLGALPHAELLSSFTNYDFLILPSVFTEMYSLVLREAFQQNLPVIASAAKGNIDIIKEGKNGFIFNYNDHKDLAGVIDKAYSLKENGWQPQFETGNTFKSELNEILSYYRNDPLASAT